MSNKILKDYYQAAPGAMFNDRTAEVYGHEIEKIVKANPGIPLIPDMVLDEAARKDSPLHDYFEWNDSTCARRYRLKQAGEILRGIIRVVVTDQGKSQKRAFIEVMVQDEEDDEDDGRGTRYVPIKEVVNDDKLKDMAIKKAMKSLDRWCERYGHLRELLPVVKAIKQIEGGA